MKIQPQIKWDSGKISALKNMCAAGKKVKEIAANFKVSPSVITNTIFRHNIRNKKLSYEKEIEVKSFNMPCIKCLKIFKSWSKSKNRMCPNCK